MKTIVLVVLFAFPGLAMARGGNGPCRQATIDAAAATVQQLQARVASGQVNSFEVLLAEKNLAEAKMCYDVYDYAAFQDLARNVLARIALAQAMGAQGTVPLQLAALAQAEKQGLAQGCTSTIVDTVERLYKIGALSDEQRQAAHDACDLLSR